MVMECVNVRQAIKQFNSLQEERVHTYQLFHEGFKAYLDTGPNYNFPMFQQLVHKVTEMFKNISDKVIEINRTLSAEPRLTAIASCISKVQDCEKDKLELTAKEQILTQNTIDHPDNDEYKEELKQVKKQLRTTMDRIIELLEELKYESEEFVL